MPLQRWNVQNTGDVEPGDRNWRKFDSGSRTISYASGELTIASPDSDPIITSGIFTLYGPIVFYSMKVSLDSNDGWTGSTSYIAMPYPVLNNASSGVIVQPTGHAYGLDGTTLRSTMFFAIANPNRLYFFTTYNAGGVAETVYISGWYYRD